MKYFPCIILSFISCIRIFKVLWCESCVAFKLEQSVHGSNQYPQNAPKLYGLGAFLYKACPTLAPVFSRWLCCKTAHIDWRSPSLAPFPLKLFQDCYTDLIFSPTAISESHKFQKIVPSSGCMPTWWNGTRTVKQPLYPPMLILLAVHWTQLLSDFFSRVLTYTWRLGGLSLPIACAKQFWGLQRNSPHPNCLVQPLWVHCYCTSISTLDARGAHIFLCIFVTDSLT